MIIKIKNYTHYLFYYLFFTIFFAFAVMAGESFISIVSPVEGARISKNQVVNVQYEMRSEIAAEHVHIYVDDVEIGIGHKLQGEFPIGPLQEGPRKICINPVNKNHTPVTSKSCVNITVE